MPQPSIRLITFTGSVQVGKHLAALAAQHMKPAIMKFGGHGRVIVCDDVDPVAVAVQSVIAKSRNACQVCVAPTLSTSNILLSLLRHSPRKHPN